MSMKSDAFREDQILGAPADDPDRLGTVTRAGVLDMQVCVPKGWSDEQILAFAERAYPCGTTHGWFIRKDKERLAGSPERNPCSDSPERVHVTLDA